MKVFEAKERQGRYLREMTCLKPMMVFVKFLPSSRTARLRSVTGVHEEKESYWFYLASHHSTQVEHDSLAEGFKP